MAANNSIGPIAQAAQQLQMRDAIPGADLWQSAGINSNAGGQGHGGEGFLSRVARAMHDGRGAEIAARRGERAGHGRMTAGISGPAGSSRSDEGDPLRDYRQDPAEPHAMGGQGADPYGTGMAGILSRLGGLVPTEAPDLKNTPRRQLRALGLGMIANSGTGMAGIGRAGLDVMAQNDAARAAEIKHQQANREAQRGYLGTVYDHLQGEREYATERADTRADRALERRKHESLADYRKRQADTAARRADAYATKVGRGSATEREISDLIARGVPPGWAQDVARGNVKTEKDDFGNIRAVNLATGEVRNLSGQQSGPGSDAGAQAPAQAAGRGQRGQGDVFGAVDEGTGPIAGLRAATNAVVGPFIEGTPFENTARARAGLRNFAQEAKTALVNNPRFPVAEQQIVQELMPDPGRFWVDPDAERDKLRELRSFLQNKIAQNRRSMSSGQVTQDEQGRLANQIESIERVLGLMGSPDQQAGAGQLPQGVPQGSRQIGTLDGKPVFETPDGRRLVAE